MSKTERALTSDDDRTLDELFEDDDFDVALDRALDEADRQLEVDGDDPSESVNGQGAAHLTDAVVADDVEATVEDVEDVEDSADEDEAVVEDEVDAVEDVEDVEDAVGEDDAVVEVDEDDADDAVAEDAAVVEVDVDDATVEDELQESAGGADDVEVSDDTMTDAETAEVDTADVSGTDVDDAAVTDSEAPDAVLGNGAATTDSDTGALRAEVDEAVEAYVAEHGADDADDDATTRANPIVADEDLDADELEADEAELDGAVEDTYVLPAIVPATPDDEDDAEAATDESGETGTALAPDEVDDDEVSDAILEELRRADIDGPMVEMAPQDDTTRARRRPRRAADYDPAPVPIPAQVPRVLGRKPRVRKVTRVVRHVDPWSVFKIAIIANLVLYVIVLTAGVLLWNVAHATGTVDNVERFFESFGWETFEFKGGEIYHAAWIAGLFVVIGLTGLAVLAATLFNLITDLVGGMRFTVLEEEVVETRTSPMRRFVVRRPEPDVPVTLHDESGAMVREGVVDDTGANTRPAR